MNTMFYLVGFVKRR